MTVNSENSVPVNIPAPVNHLSGYQQAVLTWVLGRYREREQPGARASRWELEIWGVPIWKRQTCTRAWSSSASRALRRLEDDGLIRRRNQVSGDRHESGFAVTGKLLFGTQTRTTHIQFTEAGRLAAEVLAVQPAEPGPAASN